MTPSRDIARLIEIMAALRTPQTGCPWDLEQDFSTIAPYTIEEAYEVADAIARGDFDDLRDELGDLLLQVAFHARMAEESGRFDFGDVVQAITAKLLRRHPHVFCDDVFGDAGRLPTTAVNELWDRIKAQEQAVRAANRMAAPMGALAGVSAKLPALTREPKLAPNTAKVGFDWNDRWRCSQKSAKKPTRSNATSRRDAGAKRRRKPATYCSPWSTLPAISMPIRKRPCAVPI
jgi:ATP diphosphatase